MLFLYKAACKSRAKHSHQAAGIIVGILLCKQLTGKAKRCTEKRSANKTIVQQPERSSTKDMFIHFCKTYLLFTYELR
jgi:hypothetical protein